MICCEVCWHNHRPGAPILVNMSREKLMTECQIMSEVIPILNFCQEWPSLRNFTKAYKDGHLLQFPTCSCLQPHYACTLQQGLGLVQVHMVEQKIQQIWQELTNCTISNTTTGMYDVNLI